MIRNKTIKFNLDKQEDRELWEWLQKLPHGYFSDVVKRHFRSIMENESANGYRLPDSITNDLKKTKEEGNVRH